MNHIAVAAPPRQRTGMAILMGQGIRSLVLLLTTNALSLHWTDALLRYGYHRANVYNVVEAGSVATILASALFYRHEVMVVVRR